MDIYSLCLDQSFFPNCFLLIIQAEMLVIFRWVFASIYFSISLFNRNKKLSNNQNATNDYAIKNTILISLTSLILILVSFLKIYYH